MAPPPSLDIVPPLINSANPWATTVDDLQALYDCSATGAVTTRTSLINGFPHDPAKHQYLLYDTATHKSEQDQARLSGLESASLNNLGYSPHNLEAYLGFIKTIAGKLPSGAPTKKGFLVSVTGSPEDVVGCYKLISSAQAEVPFPLAMEINLSCPNIPGKPPPAYNGKALLDYLLALKEVASDASLTRIPFGLKTPPYTQSTEYTALIGALVESAAADSSGICPVSFITATNTLGSCVVISPPDGSSSVQPVLPGTGIGGMAGAPLHPLALGNVLTIRKMLDENKDALGHIQVIGIGGVLDADGYRRMKGVGASVVGVGTGLGLKGVGIFAEIEKGLGSSW